MLSLCCSSPTVIGPCFAACWPFSVTTLLLTRAAGGSGQGKGALLWNIGLDVRSVTGVPACTGTYSAVQLAEVIQAVLQWSRGMVGCVTVNTPLLANVAAGILKGEQVPVRLLHAPVMFLLLTVHCCCRCCFNAQYCSVCGHYQPGLQPLLVAACMAGLHSCTSCHVASVAWVKHHAAVWRPLPRGCLHSMPPDTPAVTWERL